MNAAVMKSLVGAFSLLKSAAILSTTGITSSGGGKESAARNASVGGGFEARNTLSRHRAATHIILQSMQKSKCQGIAAFPNGQLKAVPLVKQISKFECSQVHSKQ
jgi:hypothetical protein